MNKQGVSPIIATVLLIIFALAIGLMVLTWGKVLVPTPEGVTEEDIVCMRNTQFRLSDFQTTNQNGQLQISVNVYNTGETTIRKFYLLVAADDEMVFVVKEFELEPFEKNLWQFSVPGSLETTLIKQAGGEFIIYPIVETQNKNRYSCFDSPVKIPIQKY